jgi:hypothetical protein
MCYVSVSFFPKQLLPKRGTSSHSRFGDLQQKAINVIGPVFLVAKGFAEQNGTKGIEALRPANPS